MGTHPSHQVAFSSLRLNLVVFLQIMASISSASVESVGCKLQVEDAEFRRELVFARDRVLVCDMQPRQTITLPIRAHMRAVAAQEPVQTQFGSRGARAGAMCEDCHNHQPRAAHYHGQFQCCFLHQFGCDEPVDTTKFLC